MFSSYLNHYNLFKWNLTLGTFQLRLWSGINFSLGKSVNINIYIINMTAHHHKQKAVGEFIFCKHNLRESLQKLSNEMCTGADWQTGLSAIKPDYLQWWGAVNKFVVLTRKLNKDSWDSKMCSKIIPPPTICCCGSAALFMLTVHIPAWEASGRFVSWNLVWTRHPPWLQKKLHSLANIRPIVQVGTNVRPAALSFSAPSSTRRPGSGPWLTAESWR